jgi:hypothetical protein
MWYTLFDRETVKVCVVIYRDSMYAPFVTQQTSILYSIFCQTRLSILIASYKFTSRNAACGWLKKCP